MEETSLEDFLDAGTDASEDEVEEPASGQSDDVGPERVDPATVEPATSTSVWTPDPRPCDACGESVQRLWRDGETAVCRACTDWDGA